MTGRIVALLALAVMRVVPGEVVTVIVALIMALSTTRVQALADRARDRG